MIPFARQCLQARPDMMVQEDNAPSHAHWYTGRAYSLAKIQRLLWPGNSPDLNAIEKAWPWLKKKTTSSGCPTSKKALEGAWIRAWRNLPQADIQKWIEGIVRNIQEVIRLEGGNEYQEGRAAKRSYHGRRRIGELFKHSFISDAVEDEHCEDFEDIDEE